MNHAAVVQLRLQPKIHCQLHMIDQFSGLNTDICGDTEEIKD